MKTSTARQYFERLRRVLVYIDGHLDSDLTLDVLSSVAAFSRDHFNRQFTALTGVGVHRYVQLARLKRASFSLAFREETPVLEIALDSGYEGPEAFSRAFKQRFGQTPSEFREQPQWTSWHEAYRPIRETRSVHMSQEFDPNQVKIVETQDTRIAVFEHRGDLLKLWDSIRKFIVWRKEAGLSPANYATFNIIYDDPEATPHEEFRLDICTSIHRKVTAADRGIVEKIIPGGRCAVLRHIGGDDTFGPAIRDLYRR